MHLSGKAFWSAGNGIDPGAHPHEVVIEDILIHVDQFTDVSYFAHLFTRGLSQHNADQGGDVPVVDVGALHAESCEVLLAAINASL